MPIRNLTDDEAAEFDARHALRGLQAVVVAKQALYDAAKAALDAARADHDHARNDIVRVYGGK